MWVGIIQSLEGQDKIKNKVEIKISALLELGHSSFPAFTQ